MYLELKLSILRGSINGITNRDGISTDKSIYEPSFEYYKPEAISYVHCWKAH